MEYKERRIKMRVQKMTKKYAYNPIVIDAPIEKINKINELGADIEIILNDIWFMFGRLSVWELSEIIFQEKPWQKAINRSGGIINNSDLENWFKVFVKEDI